VTGVQTCALPISDLGVSWARGRPVVDLLARAMPITLTINAIASAIIYLVAIPLGVWCASKTGTRTERLVSGAMLAMWSLPIVWVATLAVTLLSSSDFVRAFPTGGLHSVGADSMRYLPSLRDGSFEAGYLLDAIWHIALPIACIVITGLAFLTRQTRTAMLETLRSQYITAARAKGVPERRVLIEHGLRNSLLPIATLFTALLPAMLAGSVVVETVFSIPGIGQLAVEAINLRDRELMLAITLVVSLVNLLAIVFADILYATIDPRVREGLAAEGGGQ